MDIYRPHRQAKTLMSSRYRETVQPDCSQVACNRADLGAAMPPTTVSDDRLSASAVRAVRQRRYAQALTMLNQLIHRHPNQANYYSNRGLLHLWRGDYTAALNDCNYAIQLEPHLDKAYNNRANCYIAMGLTVKALIDYERAVDLNPFNCRARVNFALTLRNLGDFDAALNCLDEALLFYKLTAQIYAERGRTYHLRGDWNCAIADYRRAMAAIDEAVASPQDEQLLKRIRRWMEELIPNSP
jgi:tetratricopeptide (TPR) repeat protein